MNNYGAKSSSGYRFTLLDGGLLLAIASLIGWLYYRSEVGIHYQWHWREAWTLIFTPRADGSLPYFLQGLGATLRLSLWGHGTGFSVRVTDRHRAQPKGVVCAFTR